jgi:plastocyanin/uncharacterized membrane protein
MDLTRKGTDMRLTTRALGGFLGNLHPALVHFPVALLSVAALLEVIQILRRRTGTSPSTLLLAFLGAGAALISSVFGFLLQGFEGMEGGLVDLHQWFGLGATAATLAAAPLLAIGRTRPPALWVGRVGLVVGSMLVLGTGFLGGEMIFGRNHLFSIFAEKPADPAPPATLPVREEQVRILDFKFEPPTLTVAPGTKVTWVNKDDEPHTATSSENPKRFDSRVLDTAEIYSFTFSEAGSHPYFCKLHPHMTGVIVVQ